MAAFYCPHWLAGIVAGIAIVTAGTVRAHDFYDGACCSGVDCRPIEPGEFKMEGGQWFLRNLQTDQECGWEPVEPGWRTKASKDFDMHGCFRESGNGCRPICIYVGGGV